MTRKPMRDTQYPNHTILTFPSCTFRCTFKCAYTHTLNAPLNTKLYLADIEIKHEQKYNTMSQQLPIRLRICKL